MSYTKTNWENGATPAINASNLSKIEDELEALDLARVTIGELSFMDNNVTMNANSVTLVRHNISLPAGAIVLGFKSIDMIIAGELSNRYLSLNSFSQSTNSHGESRVDVSYSNTSSSDIVVTALSIKITYAVVNSNS